MTVFENKPASPAVRISKRDNKTTDFFYDGGGRSKVLNQILHCVRFSPGVIALTGPTGSGRSLIIQGLAQLFREDESDLCVFPEDIPVLETEEELYQALAGGFGLEQKPVEILEDLVERVQHFIRVGLRAKRNLLIAVDDVKQHSEEVLETLLHLVGSNKGLSLLLSGETSLLETLKQFHVQSLLIHQIALRPLLTEEAFDFLRQYLAHHGVSDETVLSRKKLDELMSRTGGNLSLLVREAQQLVLNQQIHNKKFPSNFPMVHMVALVSVIAITVLAFLYYPMSTQKNLDSELQKTAPAIETADASPVVAGAPKPAVAEKVPPAGEKPIISMPVVPEPFVIEPNTGSPTEVPKQEYTQQEQELLNKPEENMTLQVSSLSTEKMARAFIQQCAPSEVARLSFYRRGNLDKPSYVVIYGDYPDKQAAVSAQKSLSATLKKSSPWPRSFADVQRDLRQREPSK